MDLFNSRVCSLTWATSSRVAHEAAGFCLVTSSSVWEELRFGRNHDQETNRTEVAAKNDLHSDWRSVEVIKRAQDQLAWESGEFEKPRENQQEHKMFSHKYFMQINTIPLICLVNLLYSS